MAGLGIGTDFRSTRAQPGMDKGVDVTIHHSLDIRGLHSGPQIFDHLIGLEDIAPDLVAPSDCTLFSIESFHFGPFLVFLEFKDPRFEGFHRSFFVLDLGSLVLAGDDQTGGQVGQPDR